MTLTCFKLPERCIAKTPNAQPLFLVLGVCSKDRLEKHMFRLSTDAGLRKKTHKNRHDRSLPLQCDMYLKKEIGKRCENLLMVEKFGLCVLLRPDQLFIPPWDVCETTRRQ